MNECTWFSSCTRDHIVRTEGNGKRVNLADTKNGNQQHQRSCYKSNFMVHFNFYYANDRTGACKRLYTLFNLLYQLRKRLAEFSWAIDLDFRLVCIILHIEAECANVYNIDKKILFLCYKRRRKKLLYN